MDLIIRQAHGILIISSKVPWDNNPGFTVNTDNLFFSHTDQLNKNTDHLNTSHYIKG